VNAPDKKLTPFEKLGYTTDTELMLTIRSARFPAGTIVTISYDDGSDCPMFKSVREPDKKGYVQLHKLTLVTPEDKLRLLTFGTLRTD
jgi:hypothetical protein